MKREDNFIAGSGVTITPSDNAMTGQRDITIASGVAQTTETNLSGVNINAAQNVGNITLTVGSGQKARLWMTAWVTSSDTSGHEVLFEITGGGLTAVNQNRAKVAIFNGITGLTGGDEMAAWIGSDTTVGTNTYTVAVSKTDSNAVTGQLILVSGKLMGDVVSV